MSENQIKSFCKAVERVENSQLYRILSENKRENYRCVGDFEINGHVVTQEIWESFLTRYRAVFSCRGKFLGSLDDFPKRFKIIEEKDKNLDFILINNQPIKHFENLEDEINSKLCHIDPDLDELTKFSLIKYAPSILNVVELLIYYKNKLQNSVGLGRKLGSAKSKNEMMAESPYENYNNWRKCTQVVDCGNQDPVRYLDDLYKMGGAKAIYEKLKERHHGMFINNARFQRMGNDLKSMRKNGE